VAKVASGLTNNNCRRVATFNNPTDTARCARFFFMLGEILVYLAIAITAAAN
jgi:hypothetical protein